MKEATITGCGPRCVFFEIPVAGFPPVSCALRRTFGLFEGRARVGEFPHFTSRQLSRVLGDKPIPPKWCPLRAGVVLKLQKKEE